MEVVTFTLELCRSVDFVSHDPGDGLLDILHPFSHLGVAHLIDLLNELVIFLPERHLGCFSVGLVLKRKRNIFLYKNIMKATVMYCILLCTIFVMGILIIILIIFTSSASLIFSKKHLQMRKTCNKIQFLF